MDHPSLQLRTLSRLWIFARYLHNIGRISLWTPISHRTLFWTVTIFGPWTILLSILRVPWSGPGLTLHILLPGLLTWWVCYVVDGGARPDELIRSWVEHGLRYRPQRPRSRNLTSTIRTVR